MWKMKTLPNQRLAFISNNQCSIFLANKGSSVSLVIFFLKLQQRRRSASGPWKYWNFGVLPTYCSLISFEYDLFPPASAPTARLTSTSPNHRSRRWVADGSSRQAEPLFYFHVYQHTYRLAHTIIPRSPGSQNVLIGVYFRKIITPYVSFWSLSLFCCSRCHSCQNYIALKCLIFEICHPRPCWLPRLNWCCSQRRNLRIQNRYLWRYQWTEDRFKEHKWRSSLATNLSN